MTILGATTMSVLDRLKTILGNKEEKRYKYQSMDCHNTFGSSESHGQSHLPNVRIEPRPKCRLSSTVMPTPVTLFSYREPVFTAR